MTAEGTLLLLPDRSDELAGLDLEEIARAFPGARSPHTQDAYRRDLAAFVRFVQGRRGPQALTLSEVRDEIVAWRAALFSGGAAVRTVNRRLACLRSYFAEKVLRGECPFNPAAGVHGIRTRGDAPIRALSYAEARSLLDVCLADRSPRGVRDYALVSVALRTGLRRAELLGVRWADVAQDGPWWALTVQIKGGDRRRTKLGPDLVERLEAWRWVRDQVAGRAEPAAGPLWRGILGPTAESSRDGPLDAWHLGPRALSRAAFDRMIRRRSASAKIPGIVSPHVLRRTFVSLARAAGAPIDRIQHAVGHADLRTTQGYDATRDSFTDHAVDYLHGL